MKSAPIAMFPVNRKTMTIDRDRLDKAIRKTEATPRAIDWLGPRQIKVVHQPASAQPAAIKQHVAQASYQQDIAGQRTNVAKYRPPIGEIDAKRIVHWIKLAIRRERPEIGESFDVQIDRRQSALAGLISITGVTHVEPIDRVADGVCRFLVLGRNAAEAIEATVAIQLSEYPKVVVPLTSLARGHRISEGDLTVVSVPAAKIKPDQIIDPSKIVGMEVRKTLRADQPITNSSIGSPILIHRGELVELRVISGGVTVTTNAKALSDGSESDLIEVQTMRPKKRLVARVVQVGKVEIVTRTPSIQYRERSQ
jgi:flagella basal body P-ring formation protein FlgA